MALAARIEAVGGEALAIVYPGVGHRIPVDLRNRDIDPFIDAVLEPAPPQR